MAKRKSIKSALVMAIVSVFACLAMFAGTTFAWFTDSVTSSGNIIASGTLDVTMEWANGKTDPTSATWTDASAGPIFNNDKWEPGYVEARHIKISNVGTLALKYNISIVADGEVSKLAEVIDVYYADPAIQITDRTSIPADKKIGTLKDVLANLDAAGELEAKTSDTITLVLKMQESAGNEYQDLEIGSSFSVYLAATQLASESDSFDENYDAGAKYPEPEDVWDGTADTSWYNTTAKTFTLSTAEELAGLSALSASGNTFSGKTVVLDYNMNLDGKQWTPIKQFSGTFDGGDHTVSNFTLDGNAGRAGFIQNLGQYPATVKNLTLSSVVGTASSNQYFGILAANGHTSILNNVHIVDCKVTTANKDAWVGGIYGYFNWTSASNCTVENLEIDATDGAKFIGGFSGNMDQDLSIDNVDIKGLKITVSETDEDCAVGGFSGQTQTGHRQPTFNNCDVTGLDIVVSGTVDVGGFIGDAGAHTIANNCTTEGKIDASNVTSTKAVIGGFFSDSGWNNNESSKGGHKLTGCSADVDIVTGGATAGGFIGSTTAYHADGGNRNMPLTCTNCSATGTVTVADGATAIIGGFAGEAERGTFKNCSTTSAEFFGKIWDGYILNDDGNGTVTVTKE